MSTKLHQRAVQRCAVSKNLRRASACFVRWCLCADNRRIAPEIGPLSLGEHAPMTYTATISCFLFFYGSCACQASGRVFVEGPNLVMRRSEGVPLLR